MKFARELSDASPFAPREALARKDARTFARDFPKAIRTVGRPVILTVTASLVVPVALGVALIHVLDIR